MIERDICLAMDYRGSTLLRVVSEVDINPAIRKA